MTQDIVAQTREASKNAIRVVYYVMIGIAITESLNRTFFGGGVFLGFQVFENEHLYSTMLFFAFIPTICRFVHGASIHIDVHIERISEKRGKALIDLSGFFIQGAFFYLMATSLGKPVDFSSILGLMLLFDVLWILALRIFGYIELTKTKKQWLKSDGALIILLIILYRIDPNFTWIWSSFFILIAAWIAAIFDYAINKDFYFPSQQTESP